MVALKDWLPPYPPNSGRDEDNAVHRAAWNDYAARYPASGFASREMRAMGAMRRWQEAGGDPKPVGPPLIAAPRDPNEPLALVPVMVAGFLLAYLLFSIVGRLLGIDP